MFSDLSGTPSAFFHVLLVSEQDSAPPEGTSFSAPAALSVDIGRHLRLTTHLPAVTVVVFAGG